MILEEFLNKYPSRKTRSTYKTALKSFFKSLYGLRDPFKAADKVRDFKLEHIFDSGELRFFLGGFFDVAISFLQGIGRKRWRLSIISR